MTIGISLAQQEPLPGGIKDFYENYNFVSTASTPSEREFLTGIENMEDLPEEMDTERIKNVKKALDRLGEFMQEDQFNMPNGLEIRNNIDVSQEFFNMTQWKQAGEKFYVRTEVYTFDEEENVRFVEAYQDREGPDPNQEPPPIDMDNMKLSRQEIHEWKKQTDEWKKNKVNTILVDQ